MILEIIAAASLAYAVTRLGSMERLRALMGAWSVTGKLAACPYCVGFWAAGAVHAGLVWPWATVGATVFGALVAVAMMPVMGWGLRLCPIAALFGGLLGALVAGVVLPLANGEEPGGVAIRGLVGALASLLVALVLDALMSYVYRNDPDNF